MPPPEPELPLPEPELPLPEPELPPESSSLAHAKPGCAANMVANIKLISKRRLSIGNNNLFFTITLNI